MSNPGALATGITLTILTALGLGYVSTNVPAEYLAHWVTVVVLMVSFGWFCGMTVMYTMMKRTEQR